MGMNHWEWEGMGLKSIFPNTSSGEPSPNDSRRQSDEKFTTRYCTQLTGVTMRLGESRVIFAQCDSNEVLSACMHETTHAHTRTCLLMSETYSGCILTI